ncbi:DNA methyltransferase [Campylobacter blaseri]|uniref:Methyltransferase n=2 Tax=Campylobacter blaseri TaxID=2042961 RepID=A0A2P8R028_9BACT|nr:DNA methyltransferase [Campylobacter blaseri]PSM53646.1 DNA methyltransferase [Campylobacter blaseri]
MVKFFNQIINGDCIDVLKTIPDNSIDLVFADPPYFMQTQGELLRADGDKFSGVDDSWDKFKDYKEYDAFCENWLKECKRVMKKDASIWVIGSFQNIYRIGYIMQNLDFWILNDVVWSKPNPVPNFKGTRFCNSHETLLWCSKSQKSKFTFNYKTMKYLNNDKQEKSVWNIGICIGQERIKDTNGKKAHSTQKPEKLLEKIILSSSTMGDIVLDPFFGTGTTGAIAKKYGRNFIGIEKNSDYIKIANDRIKNINFVESDIASGKLETKPPKVSLDMLYQADMICLGEMLYDKAGNNPVKYIGNDRVSDGSDELSIHKMSAKILNKVNHNGWSYFYIMRDGALFEIDKLRYLYKEKNAR